MAKVKKVGISGRAKGGDGTRSGFVGAIAQISIPTSGIKMSIYGRSGTGKTTLASTFPKKLLLVRGEDGTRSIYNVPGVDVTPLLRTPEELREVCEYQDRTGKYKTIVLDTASAYQDIVLRSIIGRDLPAQLGYGEVTRDQWGQCAMATKEGLQQLLNLADSGCNVVIIAQEREFNVGEEGADMLAPSVGSSLSPSIARWLDPSAEYIVQTFKRMGVIKVPVKVAKKTIMRSKEKVQYCLRTGPHPVYMTKFRVPLGTVLPDWVVDANFDKLHKLIMGE